MILRIYQGSTQDIVVTVTDAMDAAVVLTGAAIVWRLALSLQASTALLDKQVGSGIAITDAVAGIATVSLTAADTAGLAPGTYIHEMRITKAGTVSTVFQAHLTILDSIFVSSV